jgi:hypothetical protein
MIEILFSSYFKGKHPIIPHDHRFVELTLFRGFLPAQPPLATHGLFPVSITKTQDKADGCITGELERARIYEKSEKLTEKRAHSYSLAQQSWPQW